MNPQVSNFNLLENSDSVNEMKTDNISKCVCHFKCVSCFNCYKPPCYVKKPPY